MHSLGTCKHAEDINSATKPPSTLFPPLSMIFIGKLQNIPSCMNTTHQPIKRDKICTGGLFLVAYLKLKVGRGVYS